MYLPRHFEQTDAEALQALMREHALATLITPGPDGVSADLVPLAFTPDAPGAITGELRGHVAHANPLWRHANGQPVLAVFHGPQAYITPSWYPSKAATHKVVPTWNYTVVQARGTFEAVEDAPWLHELVSGLTAQHEAPRTTPWAVADAPDDYVQQMLRAIVGIRIRVTALVGKWKVSQNRAEADRLGVADGLATDVGADAMAVLVRSSTPFNPETPR